MGKMNKELQTLLTSGIFKTILNSEAVELAEINAAVALLIKLGIPFELTFTQNTVSNPAAVEFTIFLNSTATVTTTISFLIRLNTGHPPS